MTAPVTSSPAPAPAGGSSRPRESTARRLLRKTLIVLAIMIALVLATIQVALWTNLPRRIVLSLIQDQLGLRVTAASLSTGWLGHTSLHDVTVSLPLADKPFLELPEMEVHHTWLPTLLLNGPMVVHSLQLDGAKVVIRQASSGRWNLQEALDLAAGALASNANNSSAASLPEVHVRDATLSLTDNHGRQLVIDPLQLDCKADSAVSWKFKVKAQDKLTVEGRVAPAAQWEHRLTVIGGDLLPWARPWAPLLPANTALQAEWTGRLTKDGLSGNLRVEKLVVDDLTATGQLAASYRQSSPALLVQPKSLVLNTARAHVGSLQCVGGTISFDGKTLHTDSLDIAAFGGPINVKGWVDPTDQTGELDAAWRQLALPGNITHDGSASVHLSRPFVSLLIIDTKLRSTGQTPRGSWNADIAMGAQGANWFNLDWHLDTPRLQWITAKHTRNLDGLALRGQVRQGKGGARPAVSLASIAIPSDPQLRGQGDYSFADQKWDLHLEGAHWPLRPIDDLDFQYVLDAGGDSRIAALRKLSLTSGALKLSAAGTYRLGLPRPVLATVSLDNPGEDETSSEKALVRGALAGDAGLEGTLLPLELSMSGRATGTDVTYGKRPVGDLKLIFKGTINADKIEASTQTLHFLGGDWDMHLNHSQTTDESEVNVRVRNLSLADVGDLAGTPPMGGKLSGQWTLSAPQLRLDINQLKLDGSGVASGGVGFGAGLAADRIRFATHFEHGQFTLAPVGLERGEGRGNARITWNRADPLHLDASVTLAAWPVEVPEQSVSGNVWVGLNHLAVDLPDQKNADPAKRVPRFNAPLIDVRAHIKHEDDVLGDVHIAASSTDRIVDFKQITGNVFGGTMEASGHFDLDQPQTSLANLKWDHLDSREFATVLPEIEGLTGQMSGSAKLEASTSPRDLAPMRFTVNNNWEKGSFRSLPLADATLNGFVDFALEQRTRGDRNLRIVLDDNPARRSVIHLGNGAAVLWGRFTRHLDQSLALQAQVTFDKLDLDEVLHAANPSASRTPGKIAGKFIVLFDTSKHSDPTPFVPGQFSAATTNSASLNSVSSTQPDDGSAAFRSILDRVYLEGSAQLSEANLANIGVISFVYNALNVFQKADQPTGYGSVDFRLDRSKLAISALRYFNRGTEVRAQLNFNKVWAMPNCPVKGIVVGLPRPLADLKLPFLQDVETAFSSLQSTLLTSVAISGTALHPVPTPLLFKDVGSDFRRFFHNDFNAANPQSEAK